MCTITYPSICMAVVEWMTFISIWFMSIEWPFQYQLKCITKGLCSIVDILLFSPFLSTLFMNSPYINICLHITSYLSPTPFFSLVLSGMGSIHHYKVITRLQVKPIFRKGLNTGFDLKSGSDLTEYEWICIRKILASRRSSDLDVLK